MKLYEIPRGSRIKAESYNDSGKLGDFLHFHKIDGAYSLCEVEGAPGEFIHLSCNTELEQEGDYYVIK